MLTVILAIIGSGALSTALTICYNVYTKKHEKNDATQLLMYHIIKREAEEYITRGSIEADELEVLMKMHQVYHDAGGNGYLDRRMDQVKHLEIRG